MTMQQWARTNDDIGDARIREPHTPGVCAEPDNCWRASLELSLQRRRGRTIPHHVAHRGPLRVQRPFYPEGDGTCHLYMLHPPGGVAGGDHLGVDVDVAGGASALLTTPGATKLYRSAGPHATVRHRLAVHAGGRLEWLPQETLAFRGADARLHTRVDLARDAGFVGWEVVALGRRAADEDFGRGKVWHSFELWREGTPLRIERACYEGADPMQDAAWGLQGHGVVGTLMCTGAGDRHLEAVRAHMTETRTGGISAVTRIGDVIVYRFLGAWAEQARICLDTVWRALRPLLWNKAAITPRVWLT